jgi:protein SCO1/2
MKSYAAVIWVGATWSLGLVACSPAEKSVQVKDVGKTTTTAPVSSVPGQGETEGATTVKVVAAERYALTGEIVSVDLAKKVLVVFHDEIKGYMPAMTMEFLVSSGDAAGAKPGQKIRAEMIPSKDGDFRLEKIWPNDTATTSAVAAGAMQLRQDTFTRGKNAYREVGEAIPDFALFDQEGRVVQSGRFRGKMVLMNFIFTRCPVVTMCPASTTKMIAAQKMAAEAEAKEIEFVSITLEPAYDTPGVLKEYAVARGIDTENFSLLTGPEAAVRDLLTQFGVIAELKGDLLQHTLTTLLIGPDGKIVHRADGSAWEPKEFVARMRK